MNKLNLMIVIAGVPLFAAQAPQPAAVAPITKPAPIMPVAIAEPKGIIMDMNIGLPAKTCLEIADLLNKLLSDEYVLYVKTQNYHWNIKNSMNFNDLHGFFGKQYETLAEIVDEVAERARALGFRSLGTLNEFIKNSQLKEQDNVVPADKEMIKNLLDDHETIIRSLRPVIVRTSELQDSGTNNFLCGLIEKHEKMSWMLRSYLK